jgi:hypothetical protein
MGHYSSAELSRKKASAGAEAELLKNRPSDTLPQTRCVLFNPANPLILCPYGKSPEILIPPRRLGTIQTQQICAAKHRFL